MDENEVFQQQLKITVELKKRRDQTLQQWCELRNSLLEEAERAVSANPRVAELFKVHCELSSTVESSVEDLFGSGSVYTDLTDFYVVVKVDNDRIYCRLIADFRRLEYSYALETALQWQLVTDIDTIKDKKLRAKIERAVVEIRTAGWGLNQSPSRS